MIADLDTLLRRSDLYGWAGYGSLEVTGPRPAPGDHRALDLSQT
jgi:hypothetical protein